MDRYVAMTRATQRLVVLSSPAARSLRSGGPSAEDSLDLAGPAGGAQPGGHGVAGAKPGAGQGPAGSAGPTIPRVGRGGSPRDESGRLHRITDREPPCRGERGRRAEPAAVRRLGHSDLVGLASPGAPGLALGGAAAPGAPSSATAVRHRGVRPGVRPDLRPVLRPGRRATARGRAQDVADATGTVVPRRARRRRPHPQPRPRTGGGGSTDPDPGAGHRTWVGPLAEVTSEIEAGVRASAAARCASRCVHEERAIERQHVVRVHRHRARPADDRAARVDRRDRVGVRAVRELRPARLEPGSAP